MRKLTLGICLCAGMALAACGGHKATNSADSAGTGPASDTTQIKTDSSHMAAKPDTQAKSQASPKPKTDSTKK